MRVEIAAFGGALWREMVALRSRVLRAPLGLAYDEAQLEAEREQRHLALLSEAGSVIGTVLIVPPDASGTARLRQMAIDPAWQKRGLGSRLVVHGEREATRLGARNLALSARANAIGFYEKLGYAVQGPGFIEVTLPHQRMVKSLMPDPLSSDSNVPRRIVDMRLRPRILHPFFGAEPGGPEYEVVRWLNRRVGSRDIDHFTRAEGVAGLVAEMAEAGVSLGLMVGRSTPTVRIENDALAEVARASSGRLAGVASVDPILLGREGALAEARRAVRDLGLLGVNIDAGFYAEPMHADDARLLPLYELCLELGVPAFVMSGPTTPDLTYNDPFAVDRVAKLFPALPIICSHGFYPRIADMVVVALRNENVFVSPDMYLFSPGGGLYVEAANGFMADQLLFGSSYPFRPIAQGVADIQAAGLRADVLERVLAQNPDRALRRR